MRHRKLAFQLQDDGAVFVSPSTVYRVLKAEGLIKAWDLPRSDSSDGEVPVFKRNEIWHMDITYVRVGKRHAYLISVLDGYSRYIVHHELCNTMTVRDTAPVLISDNGSQLIAKKFQTLLQRYGVDHRRIAVGHPEANGKIEVFHKTLKYERIYVQDRYTNFFQAKHDIDQFVHYYNTKRLHQGIDFVTPKQRYTGEDKLILERRRDNHQTAIARRKEINRRLKAEKTPTAA